MSLCLLLSWPPCSGCSLADLACADPGTRGFCQPQSPPGLGCSALARQNVLFAFGATAGRLRYSERAAEEDNLEADVLEPDGDAALPAPDESDEPLPGARRGPRGWAETAFPAAQAAGENWQGVNHAGFRPYKFLGFYQAAAVWKDFMQKNGQSGAGGQLFAASAPAWLPAS